MSSPGAMAVKAKKNLTREQVQARRTPAAFFPGATRPHIPVPPPRGPPTPQVNSPANYFPHGPPSVFNKTPKQVRLEKRQANAAAAAPVGSGVNLALDLNESAGGNASPTGGKRFTRKSRKTRKSFKKNKKSRKHK